MTNDEANKTAEDAAGTPAPDTKTPEPTESATPAQTHDEEDVKALLSRRTFDGKGEAAVPPSNFKGFATEGVEKTELKPIEDVAQEVLNGSWGPNATVVSQRLHDAGYDVLEVEKEYNRRKAAGAPSALQ